MNSTFPFLISYKFQSHHNSCKSGNSKSLSFHSGDFWFFVFFFVFLLLYVKVR